MWVLRNYSRSDDELIDELQLVDFDLEHGEALLGFAPTKLGSTPLEWSTVVELAEGFKVPVALDKDADYFLDFDAEPDPVGAESGPLAVTSA